MRAVESAKGSLYNALIGFAVVILCRVIAGLIGGALGAPGGGGAAAGTAFECLACGSAALSAEEGVDA